MLRHLVRLILPTPLEVGDLGRSHRVETSLSIGVDTCFGWVIGSTCRGLAIRQANFLI
jgi:hypothetical protein